MTIANDAEACFQRYSAVIAKGRVMMDAPPGPERAAAIDTHVAEMMPFFLPKVTALGAGPPVQWETAEHGTAALRVTMERYCEKETGFDGTPKNLEVLPMFDFGTRGAAIVKVTWQMRLPPGAPVEPWEVEARYMYRKYDSGEEGFEAVYTDGELAAVTKVFPDFYDNMLPGQRA